MIQNWLLIDFDNTMMATEQYAVPSLIARFNELYAHIIGRTLTYDEFKVHFHGQARETLCANLSKHFQIDVDYLTLYESREWRIMQHLQSLPDGIEMAPFLIDTLKDLSLQGFGLALVSNNPIQRAFTAMRFASNNRGTELANLLGTSFFEAGTQQKPKPDVYLRAMAQLNTKPQHCFAIEDSITGAQAALAAGIKTFAYTGFAPNATEMASKLIALGCKQAFHKWPELPALLKPFLD